MSDIGAGQAGESEAERWARRERLWQRLLAGELTEVFQVAGEGFLSGRFGLEPISLAAYQYNAAGESTSSAECEEIARGLAAQGHWAVHSEGLMWTKDSALTTWEYQGGLPASERENGVIAWDRIFIERAQIALIVLRTRRPNALVRSVRALMRTRRTRESDEPGFAAGVEPDRTQVEFFKRLKLGTTAFAMKYGPRPPYGLAVARCLLDEYPDKTLIVSDPYEIDQLRTLRIPRR